MNFTGKSLANTLKDAGCQVFLNTLDKIPGVKDLVLSKTILVQLDSICGMQKLRQNAVDKVFKLQASPVISESKNRVYVIRSSIEEVQLVAKQINDYLFGEDDKPTETDVKFWIIFVPKLVHYCDLALEEEGVYEYISVLECPLGLIPLEYDVYSLEDETIFKTLFLNKDSTPLRDIVNSIWQLQLLSGNIVNVHGQGKYAKIVADKLDQSNIIFADEFPRHARKGSLDLDLPRKGFERINFDDETPPPKLEKVKKDEVAFTDLYLIDRDCDFASILLSQLNYEGILDESFNICCNKLEFSTGDEASNTSTKHSLSHDMDPIFGDIRDNHFSTVFSLLKTKNHEMKEKYSRSQDMNLANLKNFVQHELKGLQLEFKCLAIHISACEEIMRERNKYDFGDQLRMEQNIIDGVDIRKCWDYINKMIAHQLNPYVPLRLLALLSLTLGGLPPEDYQKYHDLYCENYGLLNTDTFMNLKKLGIITEMNISLNSLMGGFLNSYTSSNDTSISNPKTSTRTSQMTSSISLASLTGVVSKAGGRVVSVASSSVLPRRGKLTAMLKKLQLVPDIGDAGYNIRDPQDPAFVFGGAYIPVICQLIDYTVLSAPLQKKNAPLNATPVELMKLLPGPNFKRKQAFIEDPSKFAYGNYETSSTNQTEKSILIYFIGGVTYAEVTALRFLAKQRNIKIAIATTSITNGNRLIQSLKPKEK